MPKRATPTTRIIMPSLLSQFVPRASAQQTWTAQAVFVQAGPWERLASVAARREQALAASPSAAAAQAASPKGGTTSERAVLRRSESPRLSLERMFLLLEEPRERQAAV